MARRFSLFSQRTLLLTTLGFFLGLLLFFFRWTFTFQADLNYLEDLYDHSQWSVAESTRRMADNELYQLVSWKTFQGADLRTFNPEVPPLGKYLIGTTIQVTGNPFTLSWLLFFGTSFVFWIFLKNLKASPQNQLLALWLLVTNPLFFSQISETMMDLSLLFFFLLHLVFFLWSQQRPQQKWLWLFLSGLSLGWMSGLKFPLFTPLILAVEGLWLWREYGFTRALKAGVTLGIATGIGYLSCFAPAFWRGFTFLHWIELQRWMVGFYRTSSIKAQYGVALITVFTGWYKGWWGPEWQRVETWTLAWPLSGLAVALGWRGTRLAEWRKPKNKEQSFDQLLLGLTTALFLINLVIPFWPRYFLLIWPLVVIFLVRLFRRLPSLITSTLIVILLIQALVRLWPSPYPALSNFADRWQAGAYEEMYSGLDSEFHQTMSREEFSRTLRAVEANIAAHQPPKIKIDHSPESSDPWVATTTYSTLLGPVTSEQPFQLVQEEGRWKVVWDWQLVLTGYSPDANIEAHLVPVFPLTVLSSDSKPLAHSALAHQVWVEPIAFATDSARIEANLESIALATRGSGVALRNKLFVLARGQTSVPAGIITPGTDPTILVEVENLPGVRLVEFPIMQLTPAVQALHLDDSEDFLSDLRTATQIKILQPNLFSGEILLQQAGEEPKVLIEVTHPQAEQVTLPMSVYDLLGPDADQIP